MKIMYIVPYIKNESAGTTHVVIALCKSIVAKGYEVVLYTLDPVPIKDYGFEIKSFKPSKLPHPSLGRSADMYKSLLEEAKNFDVIHNHILWMAPNYYSGLVARKLGVPYIISPHGTLSAWALSRSKWKKYISLLLGQKKALDTASCFHVTAHSEKKEIVEFGYNAPCTVIPNGVDIPLNIKKKRLSKLNNIVFMSRIHPKKGLDLLIKAWCKIQDNHSNWELIIIGPDDDSYSSEMKKLAKKNFSKRLHFIGEVTGDEKYQYLIDANIFVFPTHSENFGMVVAEALACGTPVICTKGAPWSELEEYNAGWWIDIGVDPLVKSLSKCMSLGDEVLDSMGINGRKWMKQKYSWDKIADDMVDTYKWLTNKGEKPNCVEL